MRALELLSLPGESALTRAVTPMVVASRPSPQSTAARVLAKTMTFAFIFFIPRLMAYC